MKTIASVGFVSRNDIKMDDIKSDLTVLNKIPDII